MRNATPQEKRMQEELLLLLEKMGRSTDPGKALWLVASILRDHADRLNKLEFPRINRSSPRA